MHSKYKYTYYHNNHTLQPPSPHTHITKQDKTQPQFKLKQAQYKIHSNEIVTI